MLQPGDKAPYFLLKNDDNQPISLNDFKNKRVVLYFYPKDNTPGCTREAIEFSLMIDKFSQYDTAIVGISPDNPESHKGFRTGHKLRITLLSDPEYKTATDYFVYGEKKNYGKTYIGIIRSTFIIENGIIKEAMYNVRAGGHAEKVFNKIES